MTDIHCHPVRYIARIVLEAQTPLSISTGNPDGVFDTALVRDANQLPAIPGTSLAGVLRHLWHAQHDEQSTENLFGYASKDSGQPSRLAVSWGAMLNSKQVPALELLLGKESERLDDPLFKDAITQIDAPTYRNRVRLSHRGTASDKGKFDRTILPAGHRFAVELRLQAKEPDDNTWQQLLALLGHPGFRLGGGTRSGLGRMKVVQVHQGRFDLRDLSQAKAFRKLGHTPMDTQGLHPDKIEELLPVGWVQGTLKLEARGLWRIGQGAEPLSQKGQKPADLLPITEQRIEWKNSEGKPALTALLVPASSIKGALAHRMAFHTHCQQGVWADDIELSKDQEPELPQAVRDLFGELKDKQRDDSEDKGLAGRIYIDDAYVPTNQVKIARLMHNVIDRFTGGVRNRMLFEEESIYQGSIEIRIALHTQPLEDKPELKQAFKAALDDLCEGRLALGSRTTTGNGFFSGSLHGSLKDWLDSTATNKEDAA